MKILPRTDLQNPLLVLSVLYIILNFNEKYNLLLNLIIIIIAYFYLTKVSFKVRNKNLLEISPNFEIQIKDEPKATPLPMNK